MRSKLVEGGLLVLTIRDYDALAADRPSGNPPSSFQRDDGSRGYTFQTWVWSESATGVLTYDLTHVTATLPSGADATDGWTVVERVTTYRALHRGELSEALAAAGFAEVTWYLPADAPNEGDGGGNHKQTAFYQPVVTARAI